MEETLTHYERLAKCETRIDVLAERVDSMDKRLERIEWFVITTLLGTVATLAKMLHG